MMMVWYCFLLPDPALLYWIRSIGFNCFFLLPHRFWDWFPIVLDIYFLRFCLFFLFFCVFWYRFWLACACCIIVSDHLVKVFCFVPMVWVGIYSFLYQIFGFTVDLTSISASSISQRSLPSILLTKAYITNECFYLLHWFDKLRTDLRTFLLPSYHFEPDTLGWSDPCDQKNG